MFEPFKGFTDGLLVKMVLVKIPDNLPPDHFYVLGHSEYV
jgi:hypothetical protein